MAVFIWPSQHPTSAAIVFVTAISLLSYLAYSRYYLEQSRRAFKLRHGCQPATSTQMGRGPFDLVNLYKIISAKRDNKLLALFHQRHHDLGRTYVSRSRGIPAVLTNDPENIKCALGTRFEDW